MFDASDIQVFFYEAMREGYASAKPHKSTISELPGSITITHQKGKMKLVDCYFVGQGDKSFGNTIIFAENLPVWNMHYYGQYEYYATFLLKLALSAAYTLDHPLTADPQFFTGCRGPKVFRSDVTSGLVYVNQVRPQSTFWSFSGREEIFSESGRNKSLGFHEYTGYMLL